ncbi:FtsK/SpoIIIE domain-containing protein [Bifidobacterium tibiigranuli]|jgi:S-DNA-T family DNA segregation ATPase FtsK/SpoIIIE|uniref:FtsK/SpoIIIE domain-containing protein n=1 Tax=Bifidobacterium tibiigranuli TaxID=2172043 RepID=UPI00235308DC|nr:FtsK/SpoIIIE domain-containing protein [Bifidobacterium tibiigranuli]MCI1212216.1 hypothetical protein [Bifidobacterium tibiigranuli]MCI1222103.1 hypothetical protein [Bifidobacterium tibiigranuli]
MTYGDVVELGRVLKRRSPVLLRAGVHTLITGVTGSGKGSIEANWLKSTVPGIHNGTVANWAVDLKGGMEFGMVDPEIIARHAWDITTALPMLKDLDAKVHARTEWARGRTRQIAPSEQFPRINLFIDEAAELCTAPTRELRKTTDEAVGYLDSIMRLSRAVGVVVIAATQDPRQQSVPLRPRFPQRVALRLNTEGESEMALGEEALKLGARPHRISVDRPGEAYFYDSELRVVQHFRALYVTDEELKHLSTNVAAKR